MKKTLMLVIGMLWASQVVAAPTAHIRLKNPDSWVDSFIGTLVYEADKVLTHEQSGDLLLVKVLPKGFIFDNFSDTLSISQWQSRFRLLNKSLADDSLLKPAEFIQQVKPLSSAAVLIETSFNASKLKHFMLISEVNDFIVVLKVMTQEAGSLYDPSDMQALLQAIELQHTAHQFDGTQLIESPYQLRFHLPVFFNDEKDVTSDKEFSYINHAFSESQRVSRYMVSSQCSQVDVQAELFSSVVLEDWGFDHLEFSGSINHNGQSMPLYLGRYDNAEDSYHMASTVISSPSCQHVVAYVVKEELSLLDRFMDFLGFIEVQQDADGFAWDGLKSSQQQRYAETITALADAFDRLRDYKKSLQLYQLAFEYEANEDQFFDLLDAYYDDHQYEQALVLLDAHKDRFFSVETQVWQAWCLVKLGRDEEALSVFELVFEEGVENDEDFFKYIELLSLNGQTEKILSMINKHRHQINDLELLDFRKAKILVAAKADSAKPFLLTLLADPITVRDYQFEVMDLLAEVDGFQEIVDFCLVQIDKGYETALLYNYLGDAQNQLEQYEAAYASMQKAHQLSPRNTNIKSYMDALRKKVGKAELSELKVVVEPVELPQSLLATINDLVPVESKSSYEYLYQINAYYHRKGDKNKQTRYAKIKINNQGGVEKNKTLQFSFDDEYEHITVNKFIVYHADGSVAKTLDQSTLYITNDDDGMLADHDRLLNIPVPSLYPGALIEWVVTTEKKQPRDSQGFVEMQFVSAVGHQFKGLLFSGDVSAVKVDFSEGVKQQQVSGEMIYWYVDDVANYKKTPYLPDIQDVFPWVKLASTKTSWQAVGDDYLSMIENKLHADVSGVLVNFGADFFAKDEVSKAIEIANYVQRQLAYQAIEFGWRAWVPNTSEVTLANRYGDCKDHAVLLYDLLNAAGIKAQLVLVNTENDISLELPNMDQFDHMIVYLPEIYSGVFVDVTDKNLFFDLRNPPSGLQGYHALVLAAGASKTRQIPASSSQHNAVTVARTVKLDDGRFRYVEKARFKGYFASSLRRYLKGIEYDELDSKIMSWVNGYYPDISMDGFSFKNLYDHSQALELTFNFSQAKQFAAIKLPVFVERYVMEFVQSPNRQWGFEVRNAFQLSSQTVVEKGGRLKLDKKQLVVDNDLMSWEITSDKKSAQFKAEVYANKKSAAEYEKLVADTRLSYFTLERLVD